MSHVARAEPSPATGVAENSRLHPDRPTTFWKACWSLCRIATSVCFDLKVRGQENIPRRGGVLILSNHESYLDPILLGVQAPRAMSYLAKSELFEVPILGTIIRKLNAFPVRQGRGDVGAINETIRRLQEGHMLNIFPEGSRSENGELGPISPGVALVLRRVEVPVIPAVIDGSFQAWPKWRRVPQCTPIRLLYGKPLQLRGLKGDEIVQLIERTFREMLIELRSGDSEH